ncbi:putative zinc-binding metallopeptidase [Aquabacterium sp. J223]|uniref:zinc-binding metallopeptidase family protein n=1 Tax=Aquabacterium sp. J223 TaxID=2898431 RepID=UPI0021ADDE9A|nr:putative zinc-binding metallopeptidase [Aquabacterium sp. J223]UUX95873.1 putative zinc-binding peptidase [Aquabacterium sp. J223]
MQRLYTGLRTAWKAHKRPTAPRAYRCRCGRPVFFRNSECLNCHTPLGYEPDRGTVLPLEPAEAPDTWRVHHEAAADDAARYRRCGNFLSAAGCNWLIPLAQPAEATPGLCPACRLNRTIPDLSVPDNQELWRRIEGAKRRMVSQLIALKLPVASKVGEDPERGLCYDFLAPTQEQPQVLTGHDHGVMVINIQEADDPTRERIRKEMGEPYRTLLGHFRHEVGHYYWDRLIDGTDWLAPYRQLFGDEREDYGEALKRHYDNGPPADWPQRFVSAYASTHPWEDWAETWSHYLHMVDTLDTALSFGIDADDVEIEAEPYSRDDLWNPDDPQADLFLDFVNAWVELTAVFTEMSRAMGQPDFYPFVLPRPAIAKLHFIHSVIKATAAAPAAAPPTPVPDETAAATP